MDNEVKLELNVPILKGLPYYTFFLAASDADDANFTNWYYTNFIQIYISIVFNNAELSFYSDTNAINRKMLDIIRTMPNFDVLITSNEIIRTLKIDMIEYLIEHIREGYYIQIFLNW